MLQTDAAPAPQAPVPSTESEHVVVRLGEIQLLVTDRQGNPVRDLRADEIELKEDGRLRKIVGLERIETSDIAIDAAPAVSESGEPVLFVPPPSTRRVVFLFDVFNSRVGARAKWIEAVQTWLRDEMQEGDRVELAILTREEIEILVRFTSDRPALVGAVVDQSMFDGYAHWDVVQDVNELLESLVVCETAHDPFGCSRAAAQPFVFGWKARAGRTIEVLKRFVSGLGSIPGRKGLLYFSDGILLDPGTAATNGVMGVLGTDRVDLASFERIVSDNLAFELTALGKVASSVDATFVPLDTRSSSARDVGRDAEQRTYLHERLLTDPYAGSFDDTRGTLGSLALATGGRPFYGTAVTKNVSKAATLLEGLYTLTYDRDPGAQGLASVKVKVKIKRSGADWTYPDRFDPRRQLPASIPLELALARGEQSLNGWRVSVKLQLPLDRLTYRVDGGDRVASFSAYVEACTPAGKRLDEAFGTFEKRLTRKEFDARLGRRVEQTVQLDLPPGVARIRARMVDHEFLVHGERHLDVTIDPSGRMLGGIHILGLNQEPGVSTDPGARAEEH